MDGKPGQIYFTIELVVLTQLTIFNNYIYFYGHIKSGSKFYDMAHYVLQHDKPNELTIPSETNQRAA